MAQWTGQWPRFKKILSCRILPQRKEAAFVNRERDEDSRVTFFTESHLFLYVTASNAWEPTIQACNTR